MDRDEFEKGCRRAARYCYLGDGLALCRVMGKHNLLAPTSDYSIAPHLFIDGYWESWLTLFLMKIIQPGMVCIDVGANLGYYTLLCSQKSGPSGRVVAVEARSSLERLIRKTCMMNGYYVEVSGAAAWNTTGDKLILSGPSDQLGGSSVCHDLEKPGYYDTDQWVSSIKIDDLVATLKLPKVDFMKIDAEGAEPQIIEGARETIKNNPGLCMMMEFAPEQSTIGECLLEELRDLGFDIFVIGYNSEIRPMVKTPTKITNLFMRRGRI